MRTHQRPELVTDALQHAQPVVLGQRAQEVLQDLALVAADQLLQLGHDLLLVADGQGRRADDGGQLAVGLEGVVEGGERPGGWVERGRFDGGSVLFVVSLVFWAGFPLGLFLHGTVGQRGQWVR